MKETHWKDLEPERREKILAQLRGWKPTADETMAGPVPINNESALDILANVLTSKDEDQPEVGS